MPTVLTAPSCSYSLDPVDPGAGATDGPARASATGRGRPGEAPPRLGGRAGATWAMQLVINTFGASLRRKGERFVVRAGANQLAVSAVEEPEVGYLFHRPFW